jgi:hypothetical protein
VSVLISGDIYMQKNEIFYLMPLGIALGVRVLLAERILKAYLEYGQHIQ